MYKLSAICVGSPMHVRRLLRKAGMADVYQPGDIEGIRPGAALLVWFAHALSLREPVPADQRETLLDLLASRVVEAGDKIEVERKAGDRVTAVTVTILDGTLVGMTGMDCWLDLRTGSEVRSLPQAPFEANSYNLTTLYSIQLERMRKDADLEARRADRCRSSSSPSTGDSPRSG